MAGQSSEHHAGAARWSPRVESQCVEQGRTELAQTIGATQQEMKAEMRKNAPEGGHVERRSPAKGQLLRQEFSLLLESNWIKAIYIGAAFFFIPVFILLDMVVHSLSCRKSPDDGKKTVEEAPFPWSRSLHTRCGNACIDWFFGLDLSAIFVRICALGELAFTLQVLFAKLTYIFLSWLNSNLESAPFGLVCVLVVIVGFSMFMLPPVPGIPVYVFSGIVISAQASRVEWIGFFGSVLLAVVLSVLTKLIACVGQYGIGASLGSSIKIQQLIGVDQVPTRAIEKLLNQRGLRPSKVAILIGGPDWPVSVTCGILRVNIPQMLLGTLPVVFISTPCVMAGSFLTRVTGCAGQDDKWAAYSSYAILVSTFAQGGAFLLAFYFIVECVAVYREELKQPRTEHKEIQKLTEASEAFNEKYKDATEWRGRHMSSYHKLISTLAVLFQLLSNGILVMFDSVCFKDFVIQSDINADYDACPPGLKGNPLAIVEAAGWPWILMFVIGTTLHLFYVRDKERTARQLVEEAAKPQLDRE